jgi:hypothetical protein
MPAGAALGAAGQIGGAVAGGKAAKKVAKIQAKTAADQMAEARSYYNDAVTRYQPDITAGNGASALYNGALGNGDADAAAKALSAFQSSTGYQTTLHDALDSVNASAYAGGAGNSGAALKALQDRASYEAQQSNQQWLGNLNTSVQTGLTAKNSLSGQATNALATTSAAQASAANASSNAALASGATTSTALQNLGNLAQNAYQSSYVPNFTLNTGAVANAVNALPGLPTGGLW